MRARVCVRKPEGRFDGVVLVPSGLSALQSYFFKFLQVSWNRKIRRFKCADDEWLVNSSSIFESRNQGFCGRNTTKWPRTGRLLTIPRLTKDRKEGTDKRNRQRQSPELNRHARLSRSTENVLGMNYSMRRIGEYSVTTPRAGRSCAQYSHDSNFQKPHDMCT